MTEDEFAAYQSLAEETEDHRWAFGTGFTDPLAGIDTSVPDEVDAGALAAYCLMLGDDALVYSHRLQQWMTRMPELEEETALANIALDLLGQARMLLARARARPKAAAATRTGRPSSWDEPPRVPQRPACRARRRRLRRAGRPGLVVLGMAVALFTRAGRRRGPGRPGWSRDPVLVRIVAKGAKELAYHRDDAAQRAIRLGDGLCRAAGRQARARGRPACWPASLSQADLVAAGAARVAATGEAARRGGRGAATACSLWPPWTAGRPPLAWVAGRSGCDGVHTEASWATCSPSRRASPAPTRTRHGDRAPVRPGPGHRRRARDRRGRARPRVCSHADRADLGTRAT